MSERACDNLDSNTVALRRLHESNAKPAQLNREIVRFGMFNVRRLRYT